MHCDRVFIKTQKVVNTAERVVAKIVIWLNRDHLAKLAGSVTVTPKKVVADSQPVVILPIAGADAYCFLEAPDCSFHVTLSLPATPQPFMCVIAHRLQVDSAFELVNGAIDLPGAVVDNTQSN